MTRIIFIFLLIFLSILLANVTATTIQGTYFDTSGPDAIIITVGKLTELKVEILNKHDAADRYRIDLTGLPSGVVEVTSSPILTQIVNPHQTIQVPFSIRTLREDDSSRLSVEIESFRDVEELVLNIPVKSKLYSLPEFGLAGFLQIIAIAAILYLTLVNRRLILLSKTK